MSTRRFIVRCCAGLPSPASVAQAAQVDDGAPSGDDNDDDDFAAPRASTGSRKRALEAAARTGGRAGGPPAGQLDGDGQSPRRKTPYSAKVFFGADRASKTAGFPITVRLMMDDVGKLTAQFSKSEAQDVQRRWGKFYVRKGVVRHASSKAKAALELQEIDESLPLGMLFVLTEVALLRVVRAMKRWEERKDTRGAMPASAVDDLVLLD